MKYIIFWTIVAWGLFQTTYKDEFGFFQYKEVREKVVYDTLSKEFTTRDSALDFMKRAEKYKPNNDIRFIDTVWMEVIFANETNDLAFESFKEEVGFFYSEEFWNWIADCSDAINDQPYYNRLLMGSYVHSYSVKKTDCLYKETANYIEHLYRTAYQKCIDSVGGVDIELSDSSQYCFTKIFGKDRK